jgi:hypothetical protein
VGPWLPCRGGRSYFRRDRFHRAHAHPGSVPGSTDFVIDRIHVGRTDVLRGVYLRRCVRLIERIVGPGHISVGGCVRIPIGVLIPADQVRIREFIPVCLPEADADADSDRDPAPDPDPDPDPDIGPPDHHPDRSRSTHVRASIHGDVSASIHGDVSASIHGDVSGRTGFVVERRPAGGLCPVDRRGP